jgi:hypothetical protein
MNARILSHNSARIARMPHNWVSRGNFSMSTFRIGVYAGTGSIPAGQISDSLSAHYNGDLRLQAPVWHSHLRLI